MVKSLLPSASLAVVLEINVGGAGEGRHIAKTFNAATAVETWPKSRIAACTVSRNRHEILMNWNKIPKEVLNPKDHFPILGPFLTPYSMNALTAFKFCSLFFPNRSCCQIPPLISSPHPRPQLSLSGERK